MLAAVRPSSSTILLAVLGSFDRFPHATAASRAAKAQHEHLWQEECSRGVSVSFIRVPLHCAGDASW